MTWRRLFSSEGLQADASYDLIVSQWDAGSDGTLSFALRQNGAHGRNVSIALSAPVVASLIGALLDFRIANQGGEQLARFAAQPMQPPRNFNGMPIGRPELWSRQMPRGPARFREETLEETEARRFDRWPRRESTADYTAALDANGEHIMVRRDSIRSRSVYASFEDQQRADREARAAGHSPVVDAVRVGHIGVMPRPQVQARCATDAAILGGYANITPIDDPAPADPPRELSRFDLIELDPLPTTAAVDTKPKRGRKPRNPAVPPKKPKHVEPEQPHEPSRFDLLELT